MASMESYPQLRYIEIKHVMVAHLNLTHHHYLIYVSLKNCSIQNLDVVDAFLPNEQVLDERQPVNVSNHEYPGESAQFETSGAGWKPNNVFGKSGNEHPIQNQKPGCFSRPVSNQADGIRLFVVLLL
jgi:hypothetical protein